MHRINVLISSCLYGDFCRYDGKSNYIPSVIELKKYCHLIKACSEQLGGLPTPRTPCEIIGARVISKTGEDCTKEFKSGAEQVLFIAKENNCKYALLKQRSPSCGAGKVYDGTFSGTIIDGYGITAALLKKNGIRVFNETNVSSLLELLQNLQ